MKHCPQAAAVPQPNHRHQKTLQQGTAATHCVSCAHLQNECANAQLHHQHSAGPSDCRRSCGQPNSHSAQYIPSSTKPQHHTLGSTPVSWCLPSTPAYEGLKPSTEEFCAQCYRTAGSSDAHQLPAAGHARTCSVTARSRRSANDKAPAPLPATVSCAQPTATAPSTLPAAPCPTSQLVRAQHACVRGLEAQHWTVLRPVLHSSDAHQLPVASNAHTCSVTARSCPSSNSIAPAPLPAAIPARSPQPQRPAQPQQHHAPAPHRRTHAHQSVPASQRPCIRRLRACPSTHTACGRLVGPWAQR
jgi:hypothetical protein